jgi:hypothetical protein
MERKTNNNLLIYQKYMDLIYYTNDLVRKYPKSERFTLVEEIKHSLYTGLRFLMYAIKTYAPQEKLKYLKELDVHISLLKVHIRLSYKYQYITQKNYETWSKHITDICNMLGGWINSCQKR